MAFKQSENISVNLREKKLSDGKISLYLDFWPPIVDPSTGKKTRRKFLKLHINPNAVTSEDKKLNKERLHIANKKRIEFEAKLLKGELENTNDITLFAYFQKFSGKNIYDAALKKLKKYLNNQDILINDVTEELTAGFVEFLKRETLHQNTVHIYFTALKTVLRSAYKKGIISIDIANRVDNVKKIETQRGFLTLNELRILKNTDCKNIEVKRMALFSALTGLRFSDIKALTWENIALEDDQKQLYAYIRIKKTKQIERIPINKDAEQFLGKRKQDNEKIFNPPSITSISLNIANWVGLAGIKKHITFHSFRHSFAVIHLEIGTDIYTVSKLLSHKDLKTTLVYAKLVDSKKVEAANRMKL